jgi:hypothetical protein
MSVRRASRRGFSYGLASTWSKTMMYTGNAAYPTNSFIKKWFYGQSFNGAPREERVSSLSGTQLRRTTFNNKINAAAFQLPIACSQTHQAMDCFGKGGSGSVVSVPIWMNNWDMTLAKNFPLRSEGRVLTFRAEFYNLPNHTQFGSINNTLQYDLASYQNWVAGRAAWSRATASSVAYNGARAPRQVALTLRFVF